PKKRCQKTQKTSKRRVSARNQRKHRLSKIEKITVGSVEGNPRLVFQRPASDLLRSAVLQKLMVIGEAAAKLPKEFRERHRNIPWPDIVAFRNIAVHAYFSVEWPIVWVAAVKDAPELRMMVADILASDFPDFS
ncbi:HepT-like ribonuclease domain-containing protein, partial [Geoalkalibacter halelectricus]|uniref:HepT-like ribonuclease domain-containing protein n=1 Tax=Geoalkalibacter halelectricus TaxID=2847045 RepID=UPI003D1FACA9